jgi:diguanylate cyclase (GGDEF)-like protein
VPQWVLHVAVAGGVLITSLLILRSATGLGMIVTACTYLWIGVYVGFFFSPLAARAHMALIGVAFGAALLLSGNHVPLDAWVFMTASVVIAGETIGRQSTQLRHEAHTDSLTGALNRKGLELAAQRTFSLADRTGIPLTAALIDLDDFKQINDRDGHQAGDRMLVELTRIWRSELEATDILARLGGDEFLVIVVGADEQENTHLFARMHMLSPTNWSAGVIGRRQGENLGACLARADSALYEAKRARHVHGEPARYSAASRHAAHAEAL